MTITLHHQIPPQTLHQCLSITPYLQDLILRLPRDSPEDILDDVYLPHLQLFKTNLPHQLLLQFLLNHPALTDLCLGVCGRVRAGGSCPLCVLDLSGLRVVECPLDCVPALAHPALYRLTGQIRPLPSSNAPVILRSIPVPLTSLSALTFDFYADDYDILQSIARAVPRLQKLKLLERPRIYVSLFSFSSYLYPS